MPITVARERKTLTDMPLLNSKGAPKKFYGDFDEVDEFLMDYEQCAAQCNLNDQKVLFDPAVLLVRSQRSS
jgi:hypothetical protein